MALDGLVLSAIANNLKDYIGARVEKISQPVKDCIIISLRHKNGNKKLLVSSSAVGARIHFTSHQIENPQTPPMFCMLLRKHLQGGKLVKVSQTCRDRVIFLDFEVLNELADTVVVTLAVEIMGHNSNIILINQNKMIIDSVKRVNADVSSVRYVLPSVKYTLPPQQDKADAFSLDSDEIKQKIKACGEMPLDKALLSLFSGFSPLICRESSFFACKSTDIFCSDLSEDMLDKLCYYLGKLKAALDSPKPCILYDKNKMPKDFYFVEIHQYGSAVLTKQYENLDSLLDDFYSEKDRMERIKQKSGDLLKTVVNISERIERKVANQKNDLERCKNKEELRRKGDILYANLTLVNKGDSAVELVDFYNESAPLIKISLDPKLTPVQNAQRYYNEYRKADTAENKLTELIKKGQEELKYIDSVFDSLTRAANESELNDIRNELYEQRYIHKKPDKKQVKTATNYLKYRSSDGFLILCGKNNLQNDKLTLRDSRKNDIWFHTQNIPGSHTVIVTEGREVPEKTLEEAAIIAAYNSKARNSSKVLVDFTEIKNVKKPSGAKPGMVIYDAYKTAVVTPSSETTQELLDK